MADWFNKERLLHATLLLILLANVCTIIGTVTSYWFFPTNSNVENSIGTFCRNNGGTERECLRSSVDALCIVSITLLFATNILGILLIKPTIKKALGRFILVGMIFAASVLLLAIIPSKNESYGFSFQFIVTACSLAHLAILINGVRLGGIRFGGIFREKPPQTIALCTESVLSILVRILTVLITIFAIVGMSTNQWIGNNTIDGWSGAGTFCRQNITEEETCIIPTSTTVLSVTAAVLSLLAIVFVVCAIFKAIRSRVECYALAVLLFPTAVILWFTIVTAMRLEYTGYSFRVMIASGPFVHLALFISGIWLSVSEELPKIITRRY